MNNYSPALDREIAQLFGTTPTTSARPEDRLKTTVHQTEQRLGAGGRPILSLKR